MSILQAVILAIVEGITEFLPVSSTGHMIITSSLMNIAHDDFTKSFTVIIQFGAILSVVVLYWRKFFQSAGFYLKLLVAFLPAACIGFLFSDYIDAMLENVTVVAVSLLLGGIFLVFADRIFRENEKTADREPGMRNALMIGIFQILSMIPGVSRSAATIIGGLTQKLNRRSAAEFSFFLAVPTMFAATCYKLFQGFERIEASHAGILIIGNIVAFIVAMLAIKTFISFLSRNGFKWFGYYRIGIGLLILLLQALEVPLNMI